MARARTTGEQGGERVWASGRSRQRRSVGPRPKHGGAILADRDHIRNPAEWGVDQLRAATVAVGAVGQAVRGPDGPATALLPEVRRIDLADLKEALAGGLADFAGYRSDVVFLCILYPLRRFGSSAWSALNYDILPLIFPLTAGFALLAVAAVGLYEMSRRREQGVETSWADAFGVVRAPAFGAIVVLGLVLLAIFLLWLVTAYTIYQVTLGHEGIVSFSAFYRDVFTTGAGWALIVVGMGVGFLFAVWC